MNYDLLIIGAGPSGLSLALSLKETNLNIAVLEKSDLENIKNPKPDGREIALTHLSKKILNDLDCWQYLLDNGLSAIKKAQVFNGNSDYSLDFESHKVKDLGFMVSNYKIRQALFNNVKSAKNISIMAGVEVVDVKTDNHLAKVKLKNNQEIFSKLIVAADSRFSRARFDMGIGTYRNDFGRTCIVCSLTHKKPHNSTAFECFHYGRTLAILPMVGNESSAVITIKNSQVKEIMDLSPDDFAKDITQRLDGKLGEMKLSGERHCYPLTSIYAKQFVKNRFALLGDAAVGMHPVTAHGFNLGLRGANTLSKIIKTNNNFYDIEVLKSYQTKQKLVSLPMYLGTNGIVEFFTNESKINKIVRKSVIKLANNCSPLKKAIVHSLTDVNQLPSKLDLSKLIKLPKLPKFPF